jgi:hypothetical protein
VVDDKKNHGGRRQGSGRKSKAEEMGLVALLNECWTLAQRKKCIRKLATLAREGDMDAIKLLMAYAFGKPTEKRELSGPGGGAIPVSITEFLDKIYGDGSE